MRKEGMGDRENDKVTKMGEVEEEREDGRRGGVTKRGEVDEKRMEIGRLIR
jgi:hypothetical protein